MRRREAGLAAVAAVATVMAGQAVWADPIVPLHQATVTKNVDGAVSAVHVVSDNGAVAVRTGAQTSVVAHESWNTEQPTLQVTLDNGRLDVEVSCNDAGPTGPVTIDVVDLVNDCTDDVTVTVPAQVSVEANSADGPVSSVGIHGHQVLHSDTGRVDVSQAVGDVHASTADGEITADHVGADTVDLRSDTGDIAVSSVVADLTAQSADGVVSVTKVTAGTISLHGDSNDISLSNSSATVVDAATADGSLRVIGVRARVITTRTDSSPIKVHTVGAPRRLSAHSSDGSVILEVPSGTYAVSAHSTDGHVRVSGLTRSATASHHIDAGSGTGNVTVSGF